MKEMAMTIRKAISGDAVILWDLRNAAIWQQCRGFYSDDLLDRWTAGQPTEHFVEVVAEQFYVATIDDQIVGSGLICLESGQLDAIFVRPDQMRRGIGKSMVSFLEELGRRAGLTELTLSSTLNAAPFYRRCGFVGDTIGIYQSPRGFVLDCVPMKKSI